jgi:O-succinylbenzoic acid--CoA ligase
MPASATARLRGLALPPGEGFIAALDAAWADGDAVLPLDPRAPPAVTDRLVAAMRLDLPVDGGVALVIATSGSTGEPKGAQLDHAALEAWPAPPTRASGWSRTIGGCPAYRGSTSAGCR